jgi:hypothetical protein
LPLGVVGVYRTQQACDWVEPACDLMQRKSA